MSDIVQEIFEEDGVLSKIFDGYKPREGQVAMAAKVYECLKKKRHGIIEAPTGTGKSFAAGLPAAVYAAETGSAVVYATANKTLQDQLFLKDCPTIKRVVDILANGEEPGPGDNIYQAEEEWLYGIIKGMSNYLCLEAMKEAEDEKKIPPRTLKIIKDFAANTATGDRADMDVDPGDQVWSQVSTSPDNCFKNSCPSFESCFAYDARERVQDCHFVVTNYHILFLDRKLRRMTSGIVGLLPAYDVLIMDEAHEVPEIAMDFRGFSFSPFATNKIRNVLSRAAQGGSTAARSLVNRLEASTRQLQGAFAELGREEAIVQAPLGDDFGLCHALEDIGNFLGGEVVAMTQRGEDDRAIQRISQMAKRAFELSKTVGMFSFGEVEKVQRGTDPITGEEIETKYLDMGDSKNVGDFPAEHVFYLEHNRRHNAWSINCKVLDAGQWLKDNIFDQKTVIVTSATIGTGGKLKFMAEQLGLEEGDYDGMVVETPFDGSRVLSVIPSDSPEPQSPDFPQYVARGIESIVNSIPNGGVMGLFTSYRNLDASAQRLKATLRGVPIFVQGEMGKRQIIEQFVAEHERGNKALILATASFWQGVDIAGKALSVVIIDKIPFAPPDDPVFWYKSKVDSSAFFRYSVPKAMIAMKQGVGRLIRRESDYGAVVIFDHRLQTKQYGKRMQSSLPEGCYMTDDVSHVADFLEDMEDER